MAASVLPKGLPAGQKLRRRRGEIIVSYLIIESYVIFAPMHFPPDDHSSVGLSLVCGPSPLLLQWRDVIPVVLFKVK